MMWCVIAAVASTLMPFVSGNAEPDETPPYIVQFIQYDLVDPGDVTEEKGLKLPCVATGGRLTWGWRFNGAVIDAAVPGSPYQVTSDGTLIRTAVNGADGTYQCFVENSKGATFSRKLQVKVTVLHTFRDDGADKVMKVTLGKPAALECPPRDGQGFGVEYHWRNTFNDVTHLLPQNERRAITPKGDMHIMWVTPDDVKTIRDARGMHCRMSAANRYEDSYNINVEQEGQAVNESIATTFYWLPPSNDSVVAGRTKSFTCIATGRPAPVVTWKKDGKEIIANEKHFKLLQLGRTLIITNVERAIHEGTYTCEAQAIGRDKIQTIMALTVKEPPYWSSEKPGQTKPINQTDEGTLTCAAGGRPAPTVTWYKNSVKLAPNDHLKPEGNKLHFIGVGTSEDGAYQCVVENEAGMIVASTWIDIQVPGPPTNLEVHAFGSYLLVTWSPPEKKIGVVTKYKLGVAMHQNTQNGSMIPRSVSVGSNEFRALLGDFEYETKYVVEIVANTTVGPGEPARIVISTIEKSAPAKPRAPDIKAVSTGAVNVTFSFGLEKGGYPLEFNVYYRKKAAGEPWQETGWIKYLNFQFVEIVNLTDALYEFRTMGKNEVGESEVSNITDARPLSVIAETRKNKPTTRMIWPIVLLAAFSLLLLVLLIVVIVRRVRKKPAGGKKERKKEAPSHHEPSRGSLVLPTRDIPPDDSPRNSLNYSMSDSDQDSLDDYGEGPQFKEDGSFTRDYGNDTDDAFLHSDQKATFAAVV